MATDLEELCRNFQQHAQIQEEKIRDLCAKVTMEENKKALERELNSHVINMEISPPEFFSPYPVLTSPAKMADSYKIFPTRHKFSGTPKDGTMDLIEFLTLVKTAQRQCRLNEEEFLDVLLACTTGPAHSLLAEWIANKLSISHIFHNFTLHFDNRPTAEDARKQLASYKAPKDTNFARVSSHLSKLASRVAAAAPDQISRESTYNFEYINALIRCLPSASATLVQTTRNSMTAKIGRAHV